MMLYKPELLIVHILKKVVQSNVDVGCLYCSACEVTLVITDTLIAVLTYLPPQHVKENYSDHWLPSE